MLKRHTGKGTCKETQAKEAKNAKALRPTLISSWLRSKPSPAPSTVAAPAPVLIVTTSAPAPPPSKQSPSRFVPGSLLGQLEAAIKMLPATIKEAADCLRTKCPPMSLRAFESHFPCGAWVEYVCRTNSGIVETRPDGVGWVLAVYRVFCGGARGP